MDRRNQLVVSADADNPLPAQGAGPFPRRGDTDCCRGLALRMNRNVEVRQQGVLPLRGRRYPCLWHGWRGLRPIGRTPQNELFRPFFRQATFFFDLQRWQMPFGICQPFARRRRAYYSLPISHQKCTDFQNPCIFMHISQKIPIPPPPCVL